MPMFHRESDAARREPSAPDRQLLMLPVNCILANPNQPRKQFD